MNCYKPLRVNPVSETACYRKAVATIIRDIQRDHYARDGKPMELLEIAEAIDVSLGTISNAVNEKSDLNAIYLMRLGQKFGAAYLNPYLRMADAQAAPLDNSLTSDILPMVMTVAHKIALARDPAGPGGATEVPQERAGYLPDLKRLNNRSGCLIKEIEGALA